MLAVHFPLSEGAPTTSPWRATCRAAARSSTRSGATPRRRSTCPAAGVRAVAAAGVVHRGCADAACWARAYSSAQLGFAVVGALLAPLAWLVARDAAARLELPEHRAATSRSAPGVLTAIAGPFVISAAVPDSTLPFTVARRARRACACPPRPRGRMPGPCSPWAAARPRLPDAHGGGLPRRRLRRRCLESPARVGTSCVGQSRRRRADRWPRRPAVVAAQLAAFGTPMPGQLADNAFLTSNEQIFAWTDQPSSRRLPRARARRRSWATSAQALWHNVVDVLLVPGNVIVVAAAADGRLRLAPRRRRSAARHLWRCSLRRNRVPGHERRLPGRHAVGHIRARVGPLLVAFAVLAVLGGTRSWLVFGSGAIGRALTLAWHPPHSLRSSWR